MDKSQKRNLAKITDYRKTFESEEGKRVLFDLMSSHFVLAHTFNPVNPSETAFNEGQRNVILRILAKLKIDPKKLLEKYEQGAKEDERFE